jgi:hypothetical protein
MGKIDLAGGEIPLLICPRDPDLTAGQEPIEHAPACHWSLGRIPPSAVLFL